MEERSRGHGLDIGLNMEHRERPNLTLASVPRVRLLPPLMVALLTAAPAAHAEAGAIDHSRAPAPDGTPLCAAWVHDEYTVERSGRTWATWHPPRDPRHHCAFGHEHG